ncbi:DNA-binding domain-containing protein [uncultured Erythrobacter sp.]|uniref:HvfC/BufC N-terminal domain-containing protein n=1 Tax=uncultured Erythrobacter sp. TaxID=263913 RepID=UPI0026194A58|nr:DNA-binding domain-containing protein [uncultured Erythrobacter sp.]
MSTSLADRQAAFLRAILDEGAPLPSGWGNSQAAGMAVYRGNYRSALMGALAETYQRTRAYVGEGPFAQASINHAISHPPSGWTIDEAGQGFAQTCASFFKDNPEAAEIAWLEWAMLGLATAPDTTPIGPQDLAAATAEFGDADWEGLRLGFQPRLQVRQVDHDLEALWRMLASEERQSLDARLESPRTCIAWRDGERPTFALFDPDHEAAITAMQQGASYGDLIALVLGEDAEPDAEAIQNAAMRAGAMLGQWLKEGMITAINPPLAPAET